MRAHRLFDPSILDHLVVGQEAFGDALAVTLSPDEEQNVARAVPERRNEFATARHCARTALASLGLRETSVPKGEGGAPVWPPGIVGSITHCRGYRLAVVGRKSFDLCSVGIDAEPHEPLPPGVLEQIASLEERRLVATLATNRSDVHWDRLLFCAKEAIYKTWYPLTHSWLGFGDATVRPEVDGKGFMADLHVEDGRRGSLMPAQVHGRYQVGHGLVIAGLRVAAR